MKNDTALDKTQIQCVAQFPAGTSFRQKKNVNWVIFDGILTFRPPKRSVRKKHLRYQLMVLVGFLVEKRANKKGFCSGE